MKTKYILLLCAALLAAQYSRAQYFDYLSTGITIGTEGVGAELATIIGPHFQLRAGYNYAPENPKFKTSSVNVPNMPESKSHKTATVNIFTGLHQNAGHLMLNYYPWAFSDFYVCAGAFYGNKEILSLSVRKIPKEYDNYILQGEYGQLRVGDSGGTIDGYILGNSLKPYLGIGIGRAISEEHFVSLALELGVQYVGPQKLYLKDSTGTPVAFLRENLPEEFQQPYDFTMNASRFYPTISFKVFFNIL